MRKEPVQISKEEMDSQAMAMDAFCTLDACPRSYHIVTFGCQMNAHDSETISGMMERMGMEEAQDRRDADLVIFKHLLRA